MHQGTEWAAADTRQIVYKPAFDAFISSHFPAGDEPSVDVEEGHEQREAAEKAVVSQTFGELSLGVARQHIREDAHADVAEAAADSIAPFAHFESSIPI